MPQKFVVPADDNKWPKEMGGMKLGTIAMNIRARKNLKNRADLESIGFDFNPQIQFYGYKSVRVALLRYMDLNGHLSVPFKFTVLVDDVRWPEKIRGMNL